MRKLKLDLEAIHVDSFPVEAVAVEERGTVQGHGRTSLGGTCVGATCGFQATCGNDSCNPSYCIASCYQTCQITCAPCQYLG